MRFSVAHGDEFLFFIVSQDSVALLGPDSGPMGVRLEDDVSAYYASATT